MKLVVKEETLSAEIATAKFTHGYWNRAVGTSCRKCGEQLFIHAVERLLIQQFASIRSVVAMFAIKITVSLSLKLQLRFVTVWTNQGNLPYSTGANLTPPNFKLTVFITGGFSLYYRRMLMALSAGTNLNILFSELLKFMFNLFKPHLGIKFVSPNQTCFTKSQLPIMFGTEDDFPFIP